MRKQSWLDMLIVALIVGLTLVVSAAAHRTAGAEAVDRFLAYDVRIDSHGHALAAYQVEITAPVGAGMVGIEGGETAAFSAAPYYDPQALTHNRVILAAFSLAPAGKLPAGNSRVARIHVHMTGSGPLMLTGKVVVAADPDGKAIPATVQLMETP
jgi:hypothetical protein